MTHYEWVDYDEFMERGEERRRNRVQSPRRPSTTEVILDAIFYSLALGLFCYIMVVGTWEVIG
jgi:hypothetical protein